MYVRLEVLNGDASVKEGVVAPRHMSWLYTVQHMGQEVKLVMQCTQGGGGGG